MKQIPVIFSPDLDEKKIFAALDTQPNPIPRDWHGGRPAAAPYFILMCDRKYFYFAAGREVKPMTHPKATTGHYQEELWKYEVAEFFIAEPESQTYLEFNLSPDGAWWSCRFGKPRQALATEPQALRGVKTFSRLTESQWSAVAKIPLSELGDISEKRLNVCFITDHRAQKFYTLAAPEGEAPDFHQPDGFLPIKITPSVGYCL